MKLLILLLGFALSVFPNSAPVPMPDFNPTIRSRGSELALAWRWLKWAARYPFDWLFHEEHYARLVWTHRVFQLRFFGAPNEPPPTYRHMVHMIELATSRGFKEIRREGDLAPAHQLAA